MKKIVWLFVALMFIAVSAQAATLTWVGPTTYVDGSLIPAAKIPQIVYTPYVGPSATGPWTAQAPTSPGATSANAPEPSPGETLWYTVDAALDGQISTKAAAVSKTTPFQVPNAPAGLSVQ